MLTVVCNIIAIMPVVLFVFWQECVKERAVKSMLCVRNISKEEAEEVVESVFDACFNDTEPFERIPP